MTTQYLYIHFSAFCCLTSREIEPGIMLPATLRPAPGMEIVDVRQYATTAFARLESESPRLRGIAERALLALIKFEVK